MLSSSLLGIEIYLYEFENPSTYKSISTLFFPVALAQTFAQPTTLPRPSLGRACQTHLLPPTDPAPSYCTNVYAVVTTESLISMLEASST